MRYRLVTAKKMPKMDISKILFIGGLILLLTYLIYIYKDKPYVSEIVNQKYEQNRE